MGSSGTRNSTNYGTVIKPDGTVVQLPAELRYSEDRGSMPVPQSVIDFEKKHRNSAVEYLILENSLFGTIGTHKGGKRSVSAPVFEHAMADMTSHNHPRTGDESGSIGGTFSVADLRNFAEYHKTDRVSTYEGIYSISKDIPNFKVSFVNDYAKYITSLEKASKPKAKDIQDRLNAEYDKLRSDFKQQTAGMSFTQITPVYNEFKKKWDATTATYQKELDAVNNKIMIDMHNWLLDNQSNYGYTYGLRRW